MSTDQLLSLDVHAAASGTGRATWGQQAIWDAVGALGADAPRYNVAMFLPLEPGRPLPAVLEDLTAVLHLHDSLRTRLEPGESGDLRQYLDGAGRLPVELWRCPADETEQEGSALLTELLSRPFDTARQWPVRIGLLEADGLVRRLAMVFSHTGTDGWGVPRLHQDLIDLARGTGSSRIRLLRPSLQPLDEAALQASERGRRRDVAARQFWCDRLGTGPERRFAALDPVGSAHTVHYARLRTPAVARAVAQVAAAYGASTSSVILAAVGVEQSRLSGTDGAMLQVVVNNRFLPATTRAVSTMAQEGLFHLPFAHGEFGDVLLRAHRAALACYRHAAYDGRLLSRDITRLRSDGGTVADYSCTFNDARVVRPDAGDPPDPRGPADPPSSHSLERLREQTTLTWMEDQPLRADFTFALDAVLVPGALELVMTADSALISRSGMEQLLRGVEDRILAEARAQGRA